jgi:hypothetical protein
LALHDIGAVHARRVHANQDAAGAGDGRFGFAGLEHLGTAETVEHYCFHLGTIPPAQKGSRPTLDKD